MHIINKHQTIYSMDKDNAPVATCASGDTLRFETCDCFSDAIVREEDLIENIDFSRINPATGPVYVQGAEPGDVLKVRIHKIEVGEQAAVVVAKDFGLLGDQLDASETRILPVKNDTVTFLGIEIPLCKMIGVIGTAPAGDGIPTGTPDAHGGNMDCTMIGEGATLYLPVNVPGALLAMGDLHAAMGDGEIGVSGAEIAGAVEVTVEVIKDACIPTPMVETDDTVATIFSAPTMEAASYGAGDHMVRWILHNTKLSKSEAVMLLSVAGNLRICQVVDPEVTLRMELPKRLLDQF